MAPQGSCRSMRLSGRRRRARNNHGAGFSAQPDEDGGGAENPWLPSIQAVAAALVVRAMGQAGFRLVSAGKHKPTPRSSASARTLWSLDRLTVRAWLG